MRVVLIGSGNVATVLGRQICQAGHTVVDVYSRCIEHAKMLASELNAGYTDTFALLDQTADIYLVALPDTALAALQNTMEHLPGKLVLHTSGAIPMQVLRPVSNRYGVLYPLQSLRKEISTLPDIPLLIDAPNPEDLDVIRNFAYTISPQVNQCGDEQRLKLHLGAVMVNNFTNHLYTLTADYCRKEALDFQWLLPLIKETAMRLYHYAPALVQTGPAIRKDTGTIEKHLALLADHPALQELYKQLSDSILRYQEAS